MRSAGSSSVTERARSLSVPASIRGKRRARGGPGFTLIEILVALAIVAIALGAVVAEGSHYIASAARMQDRTFAHWIAMDRIAEQQLLGTWPGPRESNGTVRFAGRDWRWTMRITETPDDTIRRVDVEVGAEDGGQGADRRIDATAIAYLERPQ